MRTLSMLLMLFAATEVLAQEAQPPAPPEVKKTVDAFVGEWTVDGTLVDPSVGKAPVKVNFTIDCQPTALGLAAVCTGKGQFEGLGPWAFSNVVGYDSEEKAVRFMVITSGNEFHDHKGVWKGDKIQFEPLDYTIGGKKATEKFSFDFTGGSMAFDSVVESGGTQATFKGVGKKK